MISFKPARKCGCCSYPGATCGGCPENEPSRIGFCDICESELYEGDEVVELNADGTLICTGCFDNATRTQLLSWMDASLKELSMDDVPVTDYDDFYE